jgi:predicted acetyltransferase
MLVRQTSFEDTGRVIEIRPAAHEEMDEFKRVVATSLAMDASRIAGLQPDWTLCAFEDGRLATTYGAWPLTMRFNGGAVPLAGVTCVSTDTIYRRRGYLRRITETDFARLKELGQQPLAALYASQAAIYQRFGYGIVSTHFSYRVEPRYLQFSFPADIPGRLREVDVANEFGLLVDIYRRFREERTGYVHRGKAMWEANALEVRPSFRTIAVVYEEDGQAQGYVVYASGPGGYEGPGPGQVVRVLDMAWLSMAAYRAFWEHFARMELAREIIVGAAPADDPLPHLLLEPRMLRATARDGLLARIIDVEVLTARQYDEEAVLRFEVVDEMCPWNAGRWQLEATRDGSKLIPIPGSASHASSPTLTTAPDLSFDVNTLTMLMMGQVSATEAVRMGRVQCHDTRALSRWDAVMRTRHRPFCADNF